MLNKFKPKSEFTRSVLTLMTGTAIAQAIPIALTPILTRLYTPEDFGLLAVFLAVFSIISMIATGRYELAIMAPSSNEEAQNIVFLSIIFACITFIFTSIFIWLFNDEITFFLGNEKIGKWLYFVPFTVLLYGIYQSIDYWLNRQKEYKQMSLNKLIQAGGASQAQILIGLFYSFGLILGAIFGWVFAVLFIIYKKPFRLKKINIPEIKKAAYKYKSYPLLQAPTSLLNTVSTQAPIFIITKYFDSSSVGYFSLVIKFLSAPAAIIAKSIGQVFFQEVSEHAKTAPNLLKQDLCHVAIKLIIISLLFFLPIFLYAPSLFTFILGEKWLVAGEYAQIIVISVAIKFIISPLSTIFLAVNKIKIASYWQVLYFFTTFIVLLSATQFEFVVFLWVFVIHEFILYMLYLSLMFYSIKEKNFPWSNN